MRKLSIICLLVMTLGVLITSCSDDETIGDESKPINPTAESGKLQFDVDGKTLVSTAVQVILNDDYISITGIMSSKGDFVQITVPSTKVGTYTWKTVNDSEEGLGLAYSPSSNEESGFVGIPAEVAKEFFGISDYKDTAIVTITSIDSKTKKMSGTFQFTGLRFNSDDKVETKIISKGSFKDVSYTEKIPVTNKNTFSTKLNGADFVATNVSASSNFGKIFIAGTRGSMENITISFPSTIKAGEYTTNDYNYINYMKDTTSEGAFIGNKGTITILSHDTTKKTISGKFTASFTSPFITEKHEASEGTFNVSY